MKDNLFFDSVVLLVVHCLHILQKHPIVASFLCLTSFEVTPIASFILILQHKMLIWKTEANIELIQGRAIYIEIGLWICEWEIQEEM